MANDTVYGLAAYVQSGDLAHARRVAARMRAGNVHINYPAWDARRRSAATSSPATGASMPISAWRTSSRSRPSSATPPRSGRHRHGQGHAGPGNPDASGAGSAGHDVGLRLVLPSYSSKHNVP